MFLYLQPCVSRKLLSWHRTLASSLLSQHLQLLAAPLNLSYQEGTAIGPGLTSSYAAVTTLTLGRVSVVEVLEQDKDQQLLPLLSFPHLEGVKRAAPDMKLVCRDSLEGGAASNLTISIAPCSLNLDPGLLDRSYLLLHYSEMDPDCVCGVAPAPTPAPSSFSLSICCPSVSLSCSIPKPDMRAPELREEGVAASLWRREVHPETFLLQVRRGYGTSLIHNMCSLRISV